MMRHSVILLFILLLSFAAQSQGRRDNMGNPIVNREPTEKEIEMMKQKMENRKLEFIDNFISTLEADDFQKVIIKQELLSFYDAKVAILKTRFKHNIDREAAVKNLENTHFKELETLISANDMTKIREMITGNFDEKEVKKKKKKKRKKEKNKN